jgi:hypothetical protein
LQDGYRYEDGKGFVTSDGRIIDEVNKNKAWCGDINEEVKGYKTARQL